jgi:hypothetical protein
MYVTAHMVSRDRDGSVKGETVTEDTQQSMLRLFLLGALSRRPFPSRRVPGPPWAPCGQYFAAVFHTMMIMGANKEALQLGVRERGHRGARMRI